MIKPLEKIVIVGGGTAGWVAASILANHLAKPDHSPSSVNIELIESAEIGTIGVGESTIPPFIEMLENLGINQQDFIKYAQGSFKLGIQFDNWRAKGESYFHPFGTISAGMNEQIFYQMWLKSAHQGDQFGLQDFSPCHIMAKHRRFYLPHMMSKTPASEARYALHLDAKLVADYLQQYAQARGVVRTEGKVVEVVQRDDGAIASVVLASGETVAADFFVDCSGFRALLIEKTLGSSYRDWTHYLPCDRAVATQIEKVGETVPFTRAIACDYGWIWRIPLQRRLGTGYVYSSQYCSDDEAMNTLMSTIDGKILVEPRVIPFKTGVRNEIWKKNCVSIGLAAGFIEPLESTAIHLAVRGMVHLLRNFPDKDCDPALINQYNRRMITEYEEIRDFIVLHYCMTEREDTPFWRWCKTMELPPSLQDTMDYFKAQGSLPEMIDALFHSVSWRSVAEGMGVRPRKYSPLIEEMDYPAARQKFIDFVATMEDFIQKLPAHDQFIRDNCAAF